MGLKERLEGRGRTVLPTMLLHEALKPADRRGESKRARLAVYVLSETQYQAGVRTWGDYRVRLDRGQALISCRRAGALLKSSHQTISRWLAMLAAELGWTVRGLEATDPRVSAIEGRWTTPKHRAEHQGSTRVGVLVTVQNYEEVSTIARSQSTGVDPARDTGSRHHIHNVLSTSGSTKNPPLYPPPRGGGGLPKAGRFQRSPRRMRRELDKVLRYSTGRGGRGWRLSQLEEEIGEERRALTLRWLAYSFSEWSELQEAEQGPEWWTRHGLESAPEQLTADEVRRLDELEELEEEARREAFEANWRAREALDEDAEGEDLPTCETDNTHPEETSQSPALGNVDLEDQAQLQLVRSLAAAGNPQARALLRTHERDETCHT